MECVLSSAFVRSGNLDSHSRGRDERHSNVALQTRCEGVLSLCNRSEYY